MKLKILGIFALCIVMLTCCSEKKNIKLELFNWSMHDASDSIHIVNANPADVHLALLEQGIIDEPFYRDNEIKLQWIGEKDWIFETDFDFPSEMLQQDMVELVFEGLDTYAEVQLNGNQILKADNMFRHWRVHVKTQLREKNNTLKIKFASPLSIDLEKQDKVSYQLPEVRGFTRKAAYQYGWDWGPRFITMGVWRPAYFEAWSGTKIKDLFIQQQAISEQKATLSAEITLKASQAETLQVHLFNGDELLSTKNIAVVEGRNKLSIPITIESPDLWWPNGMGDQHLYTFRLELSSTSEITDERTVKTGLRNIQLIQKKDSVGQGFYFQVNGKPVFAKGANYIPQDNFLTRTTAADYHQLFETVVASHMNMLRVWGGGIYEEDLFYDLCDENGILVWQDFMFACNFYPGDSAFVENVQQEARQNIKRLRNHPSIALWCGNNEVDEAWHNWGWQKALRYSTADSTEIWNNYLALFEDILPTAVQDLHPDCVYWPSSPSNGWGNEIAFQEGDVHFWGVWWGRQAFEEYENKVGRFMSEYGFQGMPQLKTIEDFTKPEDRHLGSDVVDVHQKHPFGWEAIQQYMERDYNIPEDFDDYVYVSQLLQARGIQIAIEAHRRAMPYCMGTLYWQLNDCWPVTSWSSVDYYGRWKALQYAVKEAYRMCLVSFKEDKNGLDIYAVTDDTKDKHVKLKWWMQNFDGTKSRIDSSQFLLPATTSMPVAKLPAGILPKGEKAKNTVLVAELWYGSNLLYQGLHYFARPKDLALQEPDIEFNLTKTEEGYLVSIKSGKLAKNVYLGIDKNAHFDDNYFDLLPGEEKTVLLRTEDSDLQKEQITIRSLVDTN